LPFCSKYYLTQKFNGNIYGGVQFLLHFFILGKTAIGFYLSKTNPGSAYGAAGSIVLILLWVSYSSMILFYGAEFTRAYADYFTGKVSPTEVAVKITDKADAKH